MAMKNGILSPEEAVKALLGKRGGGTGTAAGLPAAAPALTAKSGNVLADRAAAIITGSGGQAKGQGVMTRYGTAEPTPSLSASSGRNETYLPRAGERQPAAVIPSYEGMKRDIGMLMDRLEEQRAPLKEHLEALRKATSDEWASMTAAQAETRRKTIGEVQDQIAALDRQEQQWMDEFYAAMGADDKLDRGKYLAGLDRPLSDWERAEAKALAKELQTKPMEAISAQVGGDAAAMRDQVQRNALASRLLSRSSASGAFGTGFVESFPGARRSLEGGQAAMQESGAYRQIFDDPEIAAMMGQGSAFEDAPEVSTGAYMAGMGAGDLAQIMTLNNLFGAGVKAAKPLAKLPGAVQNALVSGLTFGTKDAADTAGAGGTLEETAKAGAVGFAGGAVGSGASELVKLGGGRLMTRYGVQNSVPLTILRDALSGTAFAGSSMGVRMGLDEEYRPTGEEAAKDLSVAFAFSTLTSALNTLGATREAKARMQQFTEDMKRDYATVVNNADGKITLDALDDLAAKSAQVRAGLAGGTYLGQQKTVDGILDFLSVLDDNITRARAAIYNSGMAAGAPAAGTAGPCTLPTGGGLPAVGGGAAVPPAVPRGTTLPTAAELNPGMAGGMAATAIPKADAANSQTIENLGPEVRVEPEADEVMKPLHTGGAQPEAHTRKPAVVLEDGTALDLPAFTDYYRRSIDQAEPEAVIQAAFDALVQEGAADMGERKKAAADQAKRLSETLRGYGIENVVVDEAAQPGIDAYWDPLTATVHLSPELDGTRAVNAKVAHELTHAAEQGDDALVGDLLGAMQAMGRDVSAQVQAAREQYRALHVSQGMPPEVAERTVDEDYAAGEVAAKFVEEVLGDEDLQSTLARDKPGLLRRVWEAIKRLVERIRAKFGGDSGEAARYEELARVLRERIQARTGLDLTIQGEYLPTAERAGAGTAEAPRYAYIDRTLPAEEVQQGVQDVARLLPVAEITGEEFKKGTVDLVTQVSNFFQSVGGSVENPQLGTVTLDRSGVKDDLGHGIGRKKAAAFAAVPAVLEHGKVIDYQTDWKGRGYDTAVVAAPVTIGGEEYLEGIVLTRGDGTNRFYVHEVLTVKNNEATPFKTGTSSDGGGLPGGAAPSIISLLRQVAEVKRGLAADEAPRYAAKSLEDRVREKAAQVRPTAARKELVDTLLKDFSIPAGRRAEAGREIGALAEKMVAQKYISEADLDTLFDSLYDAGQVLVEDGAYEDYQDIRKWLRGSKVYVPQAVKAEFGDDWNAFRAQAMGNGLILTNAATAQGIDSLYGELAGTFGTGDFPDETDGTAMLRRMVETAAMGKPEFEGLAAAAARRGGTEEAKAQYDAMAVKLADTVKRFSDMAGLEIKMKLRNITDVEGLREHYRDLAAKQAQRRHVSDVRKSTLNTVKWLRKKARYNSAGLREAMDKQPAEVQEQVKKVLDELDTVAASITDKWAGKWEELRGIHEQFMAENPNYIPNKRTLENVARLDQKHLADMDPQTVEAIREVVLKLRHEMETSGKELGEAEAKEFSALYRQAKEELEHTKGNERESGVRKLFTEESLAPTRVLRMYGGWRKDGVFSRMAAQLEQGEYEAMDYVNRADRRFQAFMEKHPDWLKKAAGKRADLIELEVSPVAEWDQGDKPIFGEPVKVYMTPMMRVQMWLDYQSYDNRRHVKHGGYTFPDIAEYQRGHEAAAYDKGRTIKLAPESVKRILEDMTLEEMEYGKLLADYYNKFSKGEINRVSVEADGYERAISTWYSPILTDKNYLHAEPGRYDATIQGMGPLQERIQSGSPVLLKDADSVYRWHRDSMSRFVGMYIPERNVQRLLEWTESGFKGSTKKMLADTWGSTAKQYMENLLVDLQAPRKGGTGGTIDSAFNALISKYVKSVLYFNPSVAVKQAASYPAAAAVLGWDALRSGLNPARKVDTDLIAKYSPLLEYRAKGYSTQELADYVRGRDGAQDSKAKKMLLGIGWIQGMDIATVKRLWAAAEYRATKDTGLRPGDRADIDAGTDPYYQKVAEVFNAAVSQTQPMYSQMHRPDLLKNGSAAARTFSLMKTVPLQYAGMLRESLGTYQRAQEDYRTHQTKENKEAANEARRGFARTVSAFLASSIVYCAMGAAVSMLVGKDKRYRDEDGDLTAESLGKQIGKELGGVAMGSVPGGEELYNFLCSQIFGDRWYDLETPGISTINDLVNQTGKFIDGFAKTVGGAADVAENGGEVSTYLKSNGSLLIGPAKDLAESVAALFGVPAANAEKYILGMVRWAAPDLVAGIENTETPYTKANLNGLYGQRVDAALGQLMDNRVAGLDQETKDELARLYKLEGGDVLPTGIPASVSVDGETVELSPYQQMVYEQTFNATAGEYLDSLVASRWFGMMEDGDQAQAVKYLYNYAGALAKAESAGAEVSGWVESARRAVAQGVDLTDYLHYKLVTDEYTSDDDQSVKEQKVAWLNDSVLSPEDRAAIYLTACAGEKELDRAAALSRQGVTNTEYFDYVAGTIAMKSDREDGKTVSGSLARKKLEFIDGMELSDEKKAALYLSEVAGDDQRKAATLLAAGGVPNTAYYAFMAGTAGLEADTGPDGKAVSGSLTLKKFRVVDGIDLTDNQKVNLFLEAGAAEGLAKDFKSHAVEAAGLGIDRYDFLKYYTVVYGISSDKDGNGQTVAGSRQKKVWAYIDSLPLTKAQKDYLHLCEYTEKNLRKAPWHTGEDLSGYLAGVDLLKPATRYGVEYAAQGSGGQVQTRYGQGSTDGSSGGFVTRYGAEYATQGSGGQVQTRYGPGSTGGSSGGFVTRYGT